MRADMAEYDGIAVGGRACRDLGADAATRAAAVIHHDGLTHALHQFFADGARQDIGGAAGREWHDPVDGACGVGLRMGHDCREQQAR